MNDFRIKLGGEIDVKSVKNSIAAIQGLINSGEIKPLKLNVEINTDNLTKQLDIINAKIQESVGSIKKSGAGASGAGIGDTGSENGEKPLKELIDAPKIAENVNKIRTEYNELNNTIKETVETIDKYGDKIVQVSQGAEGATLKLTKETKTHKTYLEENLSLYDKIEKRIQNLKQTGSIGSSAAQDFTAQLEQTKELTGKEQNQSLKALNQSISDSRKQVRGFGADLKTAFEKMGVWLIAGDIFFKLIRALKDVVVQVKELDKALTSLQIVTQVSNAELDQMVDTYILMGKSLGATLTDMTSAADDFLRAGKTVADTNRLIESSITLSKIANINSADSTKYLIAAMNAYKLEANEVISVVDKLSAVDVEAAVSSEGLAISMSKTANSANLAGVSMDKLFGFIAAVKEVSQESDEAIGNFYKTLFARMQQVRIGSLVDEDGEDISDVQTVLKQYGMDVLTASGELENMGEVLDTLNSKWDSLTNAQKSEIATTLAGVRQRDRLLTLMNNYDRALALETVSLESAGSAAEKYAIYSNSIEAAVNRQKLAWQELSLVTLDSDLVKFFVNLSAAMSELLTQLGGLQALIPVIISLIATVKIKSLVTLITRLSSSLTVVGNNLLFTASATKTLTLSLGKLQLILGAITLAIAAIMVIRGKWLQNKEDEARAAEERIEKTKEEIDTLKDLKAEYLTLSSRTEKSENDKERLLAITDELIKKYGLEKEALDKLNGSYGDQSRVFDDTIYKKNAELLQQQEASYEQAQNYLNTVIDERTGWDKNQVGTSASTANAIKTPFAAFGIGQKRISDIGRSQGFTVGGNKTMYGAQTPQQALEALKRFRNELNELDDKSKYELKYIDSISAKIDSLNSEIEANKKIMSDYESTEAYQKFYEYANNALAVFQENLSTFSKATLADKTQLIPALKAQLDDLVESYPEQASYLKALAADFTSLADEIMTADYALDLLQKEENEYKREYESLKKEREEQEKILAIEQARLALQEAKNKKVRIYREGVGFVFETDFKEVQDAQSKLDKLLQDDVYNRKIKEFEELVKEYNRAATEYGVETVREYFRNEDNMTAYTASSYEQRLELLRKYLENKKKLESTVGDGESKETKTPPPPPVIQPLPPATWSGGEYVSAYAGYSRKSIQTELREMSRRNSDGEYTENIKNMQAFLDSGAKVYHTGGIAGVENFNPSTEIVAKLKKNETILTEGQTRDISQALRNGDANGGTNISIGNISLPNVQDSDGFIRAMQNIETQAVKSTKARR